MSAVLAAARYNNARLHSFADWYRENEPALIERFEVLGTVLRDDGTFITRQGDDFFSFAASQYDAQRALKSFDEHNPIPWSMRPENRT